AVLHPRAEGLRPHRSGRTLQGAVHAGHAGPRDVQGQERQMALPGRGKIRERRGPPRPNGRTRHRRPQRENVQVEKNTVDPLEILDSYGADAVRLFVLSDSPPERDLEWTESGIEGAWKYVNRLWRLVARADFTGTGGDADALRRKIHRTIHA